MGGEYSTLALGEIAGSEKGLSSDLSLWESAKVVAKEIHDHEYFIGFGAGFAEGKSLRKQFEEMQSVLSLEERIGLYLYLTQQRRAFRAFEEINLERFLQHHTFWANYELPKQIANTVLEALKTQKLQRAIDTVKNYYRSDYRIAAWKSFEQIASLLVHLRTAKKKTLLTAEQRTDRRLHIEMLVKNWIQKHTKEADI